MDLNLHLEVLMLLRELKSDLHAKTEDGIIADLEKAILLLEAAKEEHQELSGSDLIRIIGVILEQFPLVVELIERLAK